jgi:hypothetical protein
MLARSVRLTTLLGDTFRGLTRTLNEILAPEANERDNRIDKSF